MTSIRRRLIVSLAAGLLVLFAVGGTAVYEVVRVRVDEAFDDDLGARGRALAAALFVDIDRPQLGRMTDLALAASPGAGTAASRAAARKALLAFAPDALRIRLGLDLSSLPEYQAGDESAYFVIHGGAEHAPDAEIARSPSMPPDTTLPVGADTLPDGRPGATRVLETPVRFRDERWNRTWTSIVGTEPVARARVAVAQSRAPRDRYLATLRDGLVLTGLLLVLGVSLLAWLVVHRGLAPLADLSARVAGLDAASLDRLPTTGMPSELRPVVERLNEALDRIELSVERERQTAANIAHELRTPLAELTTITELAARWPDDAEITARAALDGHAIAVHMTRVVSALLKVARIDAGHAELQPTAVDLQELLDDAWNGLEAQAAERSITLDESELAARTATTDREVAEAIVASLLKNAVQHAPAGTEVRCWSRDARGGATVLGIENAAPDLTAEDMEQVQTVFWRKDAARTPSGHLGLGLSVAAALARSAGIELAPELKGGWFRIRLVFAGENDAGIAGTPLYSPFDGR